MASPQASRSRGFTVPNNAVQKTRAGSPHTRSRTGSRSSFRDSPGGSPSWSSRKTYINTPSTDSPTRGRKSYRAFASSAALKRTGAVGSTGYENIPDGLPVALDRAWESKEELKCVAGMIKEFVSVAEGFGKAMGKAVTGFPFPRSETLTVDGTEVPTSLKSGYSRTCESLRKTATWLSGACVGIKKYHSRFVSFRHDQSKEKRSLQAEGLKIEKLLQKAEDAHAVAKKNFELACKEAEKAISKRDRFKTESSEKSGRKKLQAMETQVEKSVRKAQENANVYAKRVKELRGLQNENNKTIVYISKTLHEIEKKRISETKEMLCKVARSLIAFFQTSAHEMQTVQESLSQIDVKSDAQALVEAQVKIRGLKDMKDTNLAQYYPYEGNKLLSEGFEESVDLKDCRAPSRKEELDSSLDVFSNVSARLQFKRFLEKERSVENLAFWEANREYVKTCVELIATNARNKQPKPNAEQIGKIRIVEQNLFTKYIARDAKESVNISDSSRNKVIRRWETLKSQGAIDPRLFIAASHEIEKMMRRDTLRRFTRSSIYQILASERRNFTEIVREIRQPAPLGLFGTEKKYGYRLRETFQGKSIHEWIQNRFSGNTGGRQRAAKVCLSLAKDHRVIPVGEKSLAAEWSDEGYYRVEKPTTSSDNSGTPQQLSPFPTRIVDISQKEFSSDKEVQNLLWQLLMTPKLSSLNLSGCKGLTDRRFNAVLQTLRCIPTLSTLKLNTTKCGPVLSGISDLIQNSTSLQAVELRNNGLGEGMWRSIQALSKAFKKGKPRIRSIDISDNSISTKELELFVKALDESQSRSLCSLDFSPSLIEDQNNLNAKLAKLIERNKKAAEEAPFAIPTSPAAVLRSDSADWANVLLKETPEGKNQVLESWKRRRSRSPNRSQSRNRTLPRKTSDPNFSRMVTDPNDSKSSLRANNFLYRSDSTLLRLRANSEPPPPKPKEATDGPLTPQTGRSSSKEDEKKTRFFAEPPPDFTPASPRRGSRSPTRTPTSAASPPRRKPPSRTESVISTGTADPTLELKINTNTSESNINRSASQKLPKWPPKAPTPGSNSSIGKSRWPPPSPKEGAGMPGWGTPKPDATKNTAKSPSKERNKKTKADSDFLDSSDLGAAAGKVSKEELKCNPDLEDMNNWI
ncbi:hypothetical protein AAMO2058_000003500 [Amorphochlora amoebiformis]